MRHIVFAFAVVGVVGVLLWACGSQLAPLAVQPVPPAATAPAPASMPVAAEALEPSPAAAPTGVEHVDVPGEIPDGKGVFIGDQSTVSSTNSARAFAGDRFTLGKFERPYNANKMDVYFPYLDIVSANLYQGLTWVYARITVVGRDSNDMLSGKYALEVDTNNDGRGDFMVLVDYPSSPVWSTDRVQVLADANHDIGGAAAMTSDSAGRGDGYETVVFDSGAGDDPDAAWARMSPGDANSVEMAFKSDLLEGDETYMVGIWAGREVLNPHFFDLNDHYTHADAGEANSDIANFYPIKGLAELDNTCRQAMGFDASGNEPGLCPQGQ